MSEAHFALHLSRLAIMFDAPRCRVMLASDWRQSRFPSAGSAQAWLIFRFGPVQGERGSHILDRVPSHPPRRSSRLATVGAHWRSDCVMYVYVSASGDGAAVRDRIKRKKKLDRFRGPEQARHCGCWALPGRGPDSWRTAADVGGTLKKYIGTYPHDMHRLAGCLGRDEPPQNPPYVIPLPSFLEQWKRRIGSKVALR